MKSATLDNARWRPIVFWVPLLLSACGDETADDEMMGPAGTATAPEPSVPPQQPLGTTDACLLLDPGDWDAVMATTGTMEFGPDEREDGTACDYSAGAALLGSTRIIDNSATFDAARGTDAETIAGILDDAYWQPVDQLVAVRAGMRMYFVQIGPAGTSPRESAEALARLAAPNF